MSKPCILESIHTNLLCFLVGASVERADYGSGFSFFVTSAATWHRLIIFFKVCEAGFESRTWQNFFVLVISDLWDLFSKIL